VAVVRSLDLMGRVDFLDAVKQWPEIEREDIYQALGFAATLMQESFVPSEHP
jgi:uncharacterized protein (DUF433 family)